jgi:dTDP-4-dehydrorhamnose 3,5-epimerase
VEVVPTRLEGPLLIQPRVFPDDRGFFVETYRANLFEELGIPEAMVQHNHSRSVGGTVRGMHFHTGSGVSKVVRCSRGRILDVLVDMRPGSATFGEWEGFELDDESMRMLYVPVGFGHGFCVLSDVADVAYLQSAYYSPEVESGFSPLDPEVGIEWPVPEGDRILSERDLQAPPLSGVAGITG